jgi:NAD(P)-dependent dehydrogenase (short-subunit alcohol dehydrogenase family)
MVQQRLGKIINIASELSLFGSEHVPSYSASKGALVQLTKSMAIEFARFNIQVNAIAPGFIDTDMVAPLKRVPLYEEIIKRTPAGRFGRPEEMCGNRHLFGLSSFRFCHWYYPLPGRRFRHPINAVAGSSR